MRGMKVVRRLQLVAGGQRRLAEILSVSQQTVSSWGCGTIIPSRRIPEIIAAAARLDPPVTLRPDDFFDLPASSPPPPSIHAASAEVHL